MTKILFNSIIKHRLILKKYKLLNKLKCKYYLICHFNQFTGLGLKLLKLTLNSLKFDLKLNLLTNKFNFKSKQSVIAILFNNISDYVKLIETFKKTSIIPFICYPLFILNKNKNLLFPIKFFNIKKFNRKQLIKKILINLLKKNLLNFFLRLNYYANINSTSLKEK